MASITGYYIFHDANGSGVNHIYEVTELLYGNKYKYKPIPICNRNDCSTKGASVRANLISHEDLIITITNIIYGIENDVRICGQCMMAIILEMQANNMALEGINFSDALEFCSNLDR